MIRELEGKSAAGAKFSAKVTSPDEGPHIIAVKQTELTHSDGKHLAFELMLDPAGVRVYAPSGSVGFQMRVEFQSRGKLRRSSDGVTLYEGDLVPSLLELQTGIPANVPFDDVEIEMWVSY